MPTPDQARIAEDRSRPRIIALWWALRPLTSVVRFMQTGAHPDDETSGMLAALTFRDGINISYACSTRGEGGQNDIGTEAGHDLGALRTQEMERACQVLGMRMYWHSTHPEDTITDFGFSKSGQETLLHWGRERTILRFAEIVRTERPDVICPTFLDVPGQHGHHRAMTEVAHAVMAAAADPGLQTNLPPWQIKKLYLPAWSGAGQSYDDDVPPPAATLTVPGTDFEPVSGWPWDRIGNQSRAYHRTQGMGRWVPAGAGRDWPLHLAESQFDGPDHFVWSGLPRTVSELAELPGAEPVAEPLRRAGNAIDRAVGAFPEYNAVAEAATAALVHIREARQGCPVAVVEDLGHRLDAKEDQLGRVLAIALGLEARAGVGDRFLSAGGETDLTAELAPGGAKDVSVSWDLPPGWQVQDGRLSIAPEATASDPYPSAYDPCRPAPPRMLVRFAAGDTPVEVRLPFETTPVVLPPRRATLAPAAVLLNTASRNRCFNLKLSDVAPADGNVALTLPEHWHAERSHEGYRVTVPKDVATGVHMIAATVEGQAAQTVRRMEYDHIGPTARARPAAVRIGAYDINLAAGKVGYVGAGNDRVYNWLGAMGVDVEALADDALADDQALARYDAIVIGIFAMRFRAGLSQSMPVLHRWAEAGGTLLTLYHRPWDNWDPHSVPPRMLEIGQPSLRWRVTDQNAAVRHLAEHPILETPNKIGPADWTGWVKERGLYFAKAWDPAYTPLLSMSDAGEAPLNGALLVADVGRGRHIHTSLILHHQMEHLVPGAFRLMANFIARRA